MRTLRHVILVSTFAMSVPAFAGSTKHVADAKPAATEVKAADTKTSAPAAAEAAPRVHSRRPKKPVKTDAPAKTGEVKTSERKAPVEAAPAK